MSITEFLKARYDEREAEASAVSVLRINPATGLPGHQGVRDEVLTDVASKRAIVALHPPVRLRDLPGSGHTSDAVVCAYDSGPDDVSDASTAYPCITLRLLAQPYAEHPDFDPSWTPTH